MDYCVELENAREKVIDMLFSYDPPVKTCAVCRRMRYLALLAMEVEENMEKAAPKGDSATIARELAGYRKKYLQVTGDMNDNV